MPGKDGGILMITYQLFFCPQMEAISNIDNDLMKGKAEVYRMLTVKGKGGNKDELVYNIEKRNQSWQNGLHSSHSSKCEALSSKSVAKRKEKKEEKK